MTGLKVIDGTPTALSKYLREREVKEKDTFVNHLNDDYIKTFGEYSKHEEELKPKEKKLTFNFIGIHTAKQCMDYKGIKCENKDCINVSCPLNKEYDAVWEKKK